MAKEIDVVIPVPDTSRTCALECAVRLGIPYREGFVKNRYVGRTFIMPNQTERRSSVRRKLNAMSLEFSGQNVLLVDDSIVRGTTSKEIVQMAREAGAKKVYFASAAPPIRYNHIYGIDLADTKALVAYQRSEEEISKAIGADEVFSRSWMTLLMLAYHQLMILLILPRLNNLRLASLLASTLLVLRNHTLITLSIFVARTRDSENKKRQV